MADFTKKTKFVDQSLFTDKQDGTTDWKSYQKARIENGEACSDCSKFIPYPKGCPSLCFDCKDLKESSNSVFHDSKIRCPFCKHTWEVSSEDPGYYVDGEHDTDCPSCGKVFTFITSISVSYESPELKKD